MNRDPMRDEDYLVEGPANPGEILDGFNRVHHTVRQRDDLKALVLQKNQQIELWRASLELWQRKLEAAEAMVTRLRAEATKWSRCCDLWQDSLGGMHCQDCSQKTFAMMREIQLVLGVGKDCAALAASEPKP